MTRPFQPQRDHRLATRTVWTVLCLILLAASSLLSGSRAAAETRTVAAEEWLRAWAGYRWLMGSNYRDLWATPIEVEVLDLRKEAGGLRPEFQVGGKQTFGLAMSGADGKSYTFRSLVKQLGRSLAEDFQGYALEYFVQDQLAATHPAAPLVVAPLAEAAGVLYTTPQLVIMPDDSALGEFQDVFANLLGTIEEFPTAASEQYAGFHGATEILWTRQIWPRLLAGPDTRIDARAFLRARLFDFLIGDWDRHAEQWRWAKLPGKKGWQVIPEDRDVAFSSYEGLLISLFRPFRPTLVRFQDKYPTRTGLTLQGWEIHRWLLPELEPATWEEIAADLRNRVTDAVIDEAVRRMPQPYYELRGAELAELLKTRRDRLPEIAQRIYRFLAAEVDVQGTDQSERVELHDLGQGRVEVRVTVPSGADNIPYFQRHFDPQETQSLRLYLRQGADTLVCSGQPGGKIKIEVIGDSETDVLEGCERARLRFTESGEMERRKTPLREEPNPLQLLTPNTEDPAPWDRPRDWRYQFLPIYRIGVDDDQGLLLGAGLTYDRFAFGKTPFAQSHSFQGAYAFGLETFDVRYQGILQHWNPRLQSSLEASISGLEQARFFGFGNDTSDNDFGIDDFFKTDLLQYRVAPALRYVLTSALDFTVGSRMTYSDSDDDDNTLLNQLRPYGVGEFGRLSFFGVFEFDTRDRSKLYGPGMYFRVEGSVFPDVWDVRSTFGVVEGEVAGYVGLGRRLLLALRVGGRNVFGTAPFQEASYIGGKDTLRGYDQNRFAGDASVFANGELRFSLGQASAFLFRGEYGLFIFGDVGRVFTDDLDESDEWHPSGGGGISVSTLERALLWSLTVARSEEQTSFYFQADFSF